MSHCNVSISVLPLVKVFVIFGYLWQVGSQILALWTRLHEPQLISFLDWFSHYILISLLSVVHARAVYSLLLCQVNSPLHAR